MANSNTLQSYLAYVAESTPGTTPGSPSMTYIRTTDPLGLQPSKQLLESEEILAHRSEEHTRHGVEEVSGNIPFEFSYGAYNDWLEALLGGTWAAGVLKGGTTVRTFTVEQRIAADKFLRYLGVTPSQLQITMNPEGLMTGVFECLGMGFESNATALATPSHAGSEAPMDGLANATIKEGGSTIGIVTSLNMTINAQTAIGQLLGSNKSDVPTYGTLLITGTMTTRFNNLDLFTKFKNETESSLEIDVDNPGGSQSLTIEVPRLKYVSGQPQDNDNVIDGSFDFRGLYSTSDASSIIITEDSGT